LAASCQPFENSKARVMPMTTRRREKLSTDETFAGNEGAAGKRS